MKDKEKQIEELKELTELATVISGTTELDTKTYYKVLPKAKKIIALGYRNCKDKVVLSREEKQKLLKGMYEQGKFDTLADLEKDGKVVLSREEYEILKSKGYIDGYNGMVTIHINQYKELKEQICRLEQQLNRSNKETAEKILCEIKFLVEERNGADLEDLSVDETILEEVLNELAKQFGVEVEE